MGNTPWWMLYIVAPVVAGVTLLIAGGVVDGIFGRDDEQPTPPSATSPAPLAPSSPPPAPASPSSPPPAPASPSSPPTVRAFAQRANEICRATPRIGEFRKPISELIPRAVNGGTRAQQAIGQQIERYKAVLRERQRRLKALRTPQGEAQAAEDFVSADSSVQDGRLAALSGVQDALGTGDRGALVSRVSRLKQTEGATSPARERRDALAQELGAKQCASLTERAL